jgi:catechol 2,3-dioxygenase-like lactoylglutathione lyase family enzyme
MNTTINTLKAHLAINVRDVTASIEFYKKLFGIEPLKVRTGYAKFGCRESAAQFYFEPVPFDGSGALSHLGIQVESTDDVIAMRDTWKASGSDSPRRNATTCLLRSSRQGVGP